MQKSLVFVDAEIGIEDHKIADLAALKNDHAAFHRASIKDFTDFIAGSQYLIGHNILRHDLVYLQKSPSFEFTGQVIDTLYLSPLLFPKKPYHHLLKDDKLQVDQLNNPLNDCQKAQDLFYDEVNTFSALPNELQAIYYGLLKDRNEFKAFFKCLDYRKFVLNLSSLIKKVYQGKICANARLEPLIKNDAMELAYALALIMTDDYSSLIPPWLCHNFPKIYNIMAILRHTRCQENCPYCLRMLDVKRNLKAFFNYDEFRTYSGEALQEKAVLAAVKGESLLAIFPTGGGKSLAFQLPALMAGETVRGLTVVISPLQSLMKDQVDHLNAQGITVAVTVNGLLDPIERANALERLTDGTASILYISPESLRSRTIEKILLKRNVVRFVIDEAHCFSAWGQDFRVDYLYIAEFIARYQTKTQRANAIPISCFTATAKQKVISDICQYFKEKLNLNLTLFATAAERENLHYVVLYQESDEEKYNTLRDLLNQKPVPTIVYVSRTRSAAAIAQKLTQDGILARPFYGQLDVDVKIKNQEDFINNKIQAIVATSAFGMGVDKKDVKLVVHYDISASLEDYIQEAGRAGRDLRTKAECYILYNDNDLDKHFVLLNQTKLSISEIQQIWKAIKDLTRQRQTVCRSALEIGRQAGWDESVHDLETRVKTAIAALENAGYVKRGQNVPHIYATGILAKNMAEAAAKIDQSALFDEKGKTTAKRIIKSLISSRSIAIAGNDDAESRVDYLADILGLTKEEVLTCINLLRQEGLLEDCQDMSAYIKAKDGENRSALILRRFAKLEKFMLAHLTSEGQSYNFKELNEEAHQNGINNATIKDLRTIFYFHLVKNYVQREGNDDKATKIIPLADLQSLQNKFSLRIDLAEFILKDLYSKVNKFDSSDERRPVIFSLLGLYNAYLAVPRLQLEKIELADVEDALLYLSKIGALDIEGGFLVLYNGLEIKRIISDNRIQYKQSDYRLLNEFYKQKIQQVHIVGKYANLMVRDYPQAVEFVADYFQMDHKKFIAKYYDAKKRELLKRNITPKKYQRLFGELSPQQKAIIDDKDSPLIVVAAGPGSGKTRVLVHKLAALCLLEDVKSEQLLMLTFSRAAASEFKSRLIKLIGAPAYYIAIKTFHSYCFDLLGRIGNLEGAENVVEKAVEAIEKGEVVPGKITKTVLVIDEAQDMDISEFKLVCALRKYNENLHLIAVGDDDQNIYQFRGSDSAYLRSFIEEYGAKKYELDTNYRSKGAIVALSNAFIESLPQRLKERPIIADKKETGTVIITRHYSEYFLQAAAEEVLATAGKEECCVLVKTNAEAREIFSLLLKNKRRAKLIQSLDGFKAADLAEIHYFTEKLIASRHSPLIAEEVWEEALKALKNTYKRSSALTNCLNLLNSFAQINKVKYYSDFEDFINESKYEDFYNDEKEAITVSTIHKAKGKEFTQVYLVLTGKKAKEAKEMRQLYVALTRAKSALYIHTNNDQFAAYRFAGITHQTDRRQYEKAREITQELAYHDVVLDFFKNKQKIINELRSGDQLTVEYPYLSAIKPFKCKIAKLSQKACAKYEKNIAEGYRVIGAEIRFIVTWKAEEDPDKILIILPTINFIR